MGKNKKVGIDFDHWSEMARKNPAAFEQMRLEAIEAFINSAPEHHRDRLRRLQWRIDQERRLARTPLGACIRLSRMMWQSVLGENGLRERLLELGVCLGGHESSQKCAKASADVLEFAPLTRR